MNRIEQILHFLKESPGDNFLTHALALEYIKAGDDGKARFCFEQNLLNNPGYIATYYHFGKLLERNAETGKAIEIYAAGMEQAKTACDIHAFSELRSVHDELLY